MKKYLSDALFLAASVALALLSVWFVRNTALGDSMYTFVNTSPIGVLLIGAVVFIWFMLFVSTTNIGEWVSQSGWRFTGGLIIITILIFSSTTPFGMLTPLVPVVALEALVANLVPDDLRPAADNQPAPPTPPAAQQVADTKPTVMRYLTRLNGISLMEEEMYEVRGVTAYGNGWLDRLVPVAGNGGYFTASACLPQAGISTDWVKLTNVSGSCGEGLNVEVRCVKRNADYCQPPVTTP